MSFRTFNVGDVVEVGPQYRGNGHYADSGFECIHTVVGVLRGGIAGGSKNLITDYFLARGAHRDVRGKHNPKWTVIMHWSRVFEPGKIVNEWGCQ